MPVVEESSEKPNEAQDDAGATPAHESFDPPLKSRWADWLDVHGGFVLLVGGFGLITLACVFAGSPAIAPVFAVFGAVLLLCAAFYSRIEGSLSANSEGVRFGVRAAQRAAQERDLPPEAEYQAILATLDQLELQPPRGLLEVENIANRVADSFADENRRNELEILDRFATWLVSESGFAKVRAEARAANESFDLVAENDEEVLFAEVKAGRRIDGGVMLRVAGLPVPERPGKRVRRALVIPSEIATTMEALDFAAASGVEVFEVWPDGTIQRVLRKR